MMFSDTEGLYRLTQMLLEQRRAEAARQHLISQLAARRAVPRGMFVVVLSRLIGAIDRPPGFRARRVEGLLR